MSNTKSWYCDLCYKQWYKQDGKVIYYKPEVSKALLKTCKKCKHSFEKSWEAR